MNTIKNFQLDKKKSGEIFKYWLKEAGLTYHEGADAAGIPYDTLNNTLNGKNELGLERALKLCVITRHTFSEYLQKLCEGYDHVDFADDLQWVIAPKVEIIQADSTEVVPNTSLPTAPTVNVTTVEMKSELKPSVAQEFETCIRLVNEEHERSLDRFKGLHSGYLERLEASFSNTLKAKDDQIKQMEKDAEKVDKAHADHLKTLEKTKNNLRKTAIILVAVLVLFTAYVVWEFANIESGLTGYLFRLISRSFTIGHLG